MKIINIIQATILLIIGNTLQAVEKYTLLPGKIEVTINNKTNKIYKFTQVPIEPSGLKGKPLQEYEVEPDKTVTIIMPVTREINYLWIDRISKLPTRAATGPAQKEVKEVPVRAELETDKDNMLKMRLRAESPLATMTQKNYIDVYETKVDLKGSTKVQLTLRGNDLKTSTFSFNNPIPRPSMPSPVIRM